MNKSVLTALCLMALGTTAYAERNKPIRVMEPVIELNAQATELVLGDVGEPVWIIPSQEASHLLGDDMDMSLHMLNTLPATAAGLEEVMYIDGDSAEKLLGID